MPVDSVLQVADVDVIEYMKTALVRRDVLRPADINVVTTKCDVRLTDALDGQAQVDKVPRNTWAVGGMHPVHDGLRVNEYVAAPGHAAPSRSVEDGRSGGL